mgnify:CR=1 FL=1
MSSELRDDLTYRDSLRKVMIELTVITQGKSIATSDLALIGLAILEVADEIAELIKEVRETR